MNQPACRATAWLALCLGVACSSQPGEREIAALTSQSGNRLTLEPVAYQFAADAEIFDRNWLQIRIETKTADRAWAAQAPALLTWELEELVEWLARVRDGKHGDRTEFAGLEPNIAFAVTGGNSLVARFSHEFHPDKQYSTHDVRFDLTGSNLSEFIDALTRSAEAFPRRGDPP